MEAATELDHDVIDTAPAVKRDHKTQATKAVVPEINPDPAQLKQVIKVLRFLRDDIARAHSKVSLPSTWMLRSLVFSCGELSYHSQTWLQDIRKILQKLTVKSQHELNGFSQFYDANSDSLLFPNNENFTASDLVLFLYRLKLHLAKIENELG